MTEDPIPTVEGVNVLSLSTDKLSKKIPPPVCAVCNKEVERFDIFRDDFQEAYVLVAKCHSDTEVVKLSFDTVANMTSFEVGVAFDKEKQ